MKKIIDFLKESIGAEPTGSSAVSTSLPTESRTPGGAMNDDVSTATSVPGADQPASVETQVAADADGDAAGRSGAAAETEADDSPAGDASDVCAQIDGVATILKGFVTQQAELTGALIARIEAEDGAGESSAQIDESVAALKDVSAKQEELNRLFESRLQLDEVQAKAFEHLHDEMQGYKQSFVRQEMLPLLKDVIFCHDVVAKEVERLREQEPAGGTEATVAAVDMVGQMLLDILYKYDVEPYRNEAKYYDPASQQCVGTESTGTEADDKRIAKVGLIGFRTPDSIVRREQVTVYKYKPTEE